jgi:transcriptional regulator with XRE-family HTH domain
MLEKIPEWSKRIRKARDNIKISQRELSKRLEMYQATVVSYELGKREPRIGFLMGLIRETGVDGDWLLNGKGDMYGDYKKIITEEEGIKAIFGDRADDMVLFLLDAIKDPFLRAIMFNSVIEYKDKHKDLYDKTGDSSKT